MRDICKACVLRRHRKMAENAATPEAGEAYLREIEAIIDAAPPHAATPRLSPLFAEAGRKYLNGRGPDYEAVKKLSNEVMQKLLPGLRERVFSARDPLTAALSAAVTCNYIDYSALYGRVDFSELETLLDSAFDNPPCAAETERFRAGLADAGTLLVLCDNAGEVFADRLLAEVLVKRFPRLRLVFAVRGGPAVNDALREDALLAGLDEFGTVIDSGCAVSGTDPECIGAELRKELYAADVILSKGQGNFETLVGCGLNVYYAFLCKCELFTGFFGVPPLTRMFVNELRLPGKERFL